MFFLKFEKHVLYVFYFFVYVFLYFLMSCFVVDVKTKTYKITNMTHFSWAKSVKDSISWTERVFCSSRLLLTLFDSY